MLSSSCILCILCMALEEASLLLTEAKGKLKGKNQSLSPIKDMYMVSLFWVTGAI